MYVLQFPGGIFVTEPNWMNYVAMATGIIGTITGVAGIIMGYVGYRRSCKMKALDLRLELRKAVSDARVALEQLRDFIQIASRSRVNNLAARGMSQSGSMKSWKAEVNADNVKLGKLYKHVPADEINYNTLGPNELESELVAVHKCQREIEAIRDKYISAMRSDKRIV
jgi:hypothetical protein